MMAMILATGMLALQCTKSDPDKPDNYDDLVVNPSMKGWELYSWQEGEEWHFAILTGTDRIKGLDEVKSSQPSEVLLVRVKGVEELKAVLDRFPAGEVITWIGEGWLQSAWGGNYGDLKLPPQIVIHEIEQYCSLRNVELQVVNLNPVYFFPPPCSVKFSMSGTGRDLSLTWRI